jgi:hypothetical protein
LANVPVLCYECVFDRVEGDDLLEVVEHAVTRRSMREVSEGGISTEVLSVEIGTSAGYTHGQERIETTDIPMIMADFTR